MHHFRATIKLYRKRKKAGQGCPFCDRQQISKIVRETEHFLVIENLTKYDVFEFREVLEHLMIVPKRHVEDLSLLSRDEKVELIDLIADYEAKDFNVYARSARSVSRSIAHQHTHLIRTGTKLPRFALYNVKPYMLIKF